MNISKRKVVNSGLKNHKPFFINIGNYRDISVQNRPLLANFLAVKVWSRDRAPQNLDCTKLSYAPTFCPDFSCAGQMVLEL